MGLFPKRSKSKSKSKLTPNESNYLTISTPTKQSRPDDAESKKVWKGFRGFHAKSKKKSKKKSNESSPRTVMMEDPSAFNIGFFETNGDTSYEVSFLSENSLASPGKAETYFRGRSAVESPSKLNTSSSSFGSFIRRRSKSRLMSSSASTFEASQKTDVFDNYYKKEEESQKSVFDDFYEAEDQHQVPIQSPFNQDVDDNDNDDNDDNDDDQEVEGTDEVEVELTPQNAPFPTSPMDSTTTPNSTNSNTNTTTTTRETLLEETKHSAPIQPSPDPPVEQVKVESTTSFVDNIPCHPLAQIFACATDLSTFEKMLFGDDLLPSCAPCGLMMDENYVSNNVGESASHDKSVEGEEIHYDDFVGKDNSFMMVDTFLSYATKRGVPLTYYQPKDVQESEWDAHEVTLYVTPGRRDDQVSVPPKVMWVARDNGTHSNANVYEHFDLSDIDSILKPEENNDHQDSHNDDHSLEHGMDPDTDENEMEHVCFSLITKAGQVYIFEASSDKQRNFVVDSLQLVVSRLAFV